MVHCTHDIVEMDMASIADGLCPLCLAAKVERLQVALQRVADHHPSTPGLHFGGDYKLLAESAINIAREILKEEQEDNGDR